MRKSYNMDLVLTVAMLTLLVLAFGWDRLAFTLQARREDALAIPPVAAWLLPLGALIQAAALLLLAWFVAYSPVRRTRVAIAYLATGLLVTFTPAIAGSGLPLPPLVIHFLTFDARLVLSAGLVSIIGLAGLLWPKESPAHDKIKSDLNQPN